MGKTEAIRTELTKWREDGTVSRWAGGVEMRVMMMGGGVCRGTSSCARTGSAGISGSNPKGCGVGGVEEDDDDDDVWADTLPFSCKVQCLARLTS